MRFYIILIIFGFYSTAFLPSVFANSFLNAAKNFAGNLAGNVIPRDPCSVNGPGAKCLSPQAALECIKYRNQALYAKMQQKGTVFIYTGEETPLSRYVTENAGNGRHLFVAFSSGANNSLTLLEGFSHNDPSCLAQLNAKSVTFRNNNITLGNIQPILFESPSSQAALQFFSELHETGQQELMMQQNSLANTNREFNTSHIGIGGAGNLNSGMPSVPGDSAMRTMNPSMNPSLGNQNSVVQNMPDWRQNIRGLSVDELEPLLSPQQISELINRRSPASSSQNTNGSFGSWNLSSTPRSASFASSPAPQNPITSTPITSTQSFGFGFPSSTANTPSPSPAQAPTTTVSGGSVGLGDFKAFVTSAPNNFNPQNSLQNMGAVAGSMGLPSQVTQPIQPTQPTQQPSNPLSSIVSGFGFSSR